MSITHHFVWSNSHCCCPIVAAVVAVAAAANSCVSLKSIWSATVVCYLRKVTHNTSPITSCVMRPTSTSTEATPSLSTQTCSSPTTSVVLARHTPFSLPSILAERRRWMRPRCSKISIRTRCRQHSTLLTQPWHFPNALVLLTFRGYLTAALHLFHHSHFAHFIRRFYIVTLFLYRFIVRCKFFNYLIEKLY